MRLLAASLVLLAFSAVADAAPREADPAFLATIVDDLPPPLPRGLAAHERGLALPRAPFAPLAPPASVPRAQAEYEANHGILIRWGNFNALHTAMVVPLTTAEPPADVWIVVGNTNQQNSATTVLAMLHWLKHELTRNPLRMVGAMLARGAFRAIKRKTNYEEIGGSPLLGVNGICIIAHGTSSALAITNAIRVAAESISHDLNPHIVDRIAAARDLFRAAEEAVPTTPSAA